MSKKPIIIPAGFKSDAVNLSGNLTRDTPRKVRGLSEKKPKPQGTTREKRPRFGGNQK